ATHTPTPEPPSATPSAGHSAPPREHSSAGSSEGAEAAHGAADAAPHPIVPEPNSTWPVIMLFVVAGMFLAAAVIGPLVRMNLPREVPPAHSHDEPPGPSHPHGPGGTINPQPDHG